MALYQFHLIMGFDCLVTLHMHTKFGHNRTNGWWDTKQREIWPLTFISITKMAAYQRDLIMQYDCLVTLHTHTKIGLNRTNGCWDRKRNEIWSLTFICITKMAVYQLDLIMQYDCLVTLHMHTKIGLNWTNGCWDRKRNETWPLTFICITKMVAYQLDLIIVSIPHQGKDTVKIWRWLLIPFLRYLEHQIHTEINGCFSSRFMLLAFHRHIATTNWCSSAKFSPFKLWN